MISVSEVYRPHVRQEFEGPSHFFVSREHLLDFASPEDVDVQTASLDLGLECFESAPFHKSGPPRREDVLVFETGSAAMPGVTKQEKFTSLSNFS
jgi:hypothetical protein